jgi:hypothetical protein
MVFKRRTNHAKRQTRMHMPCRFPLLHAANGQTDPNTENVWSPHCVTSRLQPPGPHANAGLQISMLPSMLASIPIDSLNHKNQCVGNPYRFISIENRFSDFYFVVVRISACTCVAAYAVFYRRVLSAFRVFWWHSTNLREYHCRLTRQRTTIAMHQCQFSPLDLRSSISAQLADSFYN